MSYPVLPFAPNRNEYNIGINPIAKRADMGIIEKYRKGLRQGKRMITLQWSLNMDDYVVFYNFYRECVDGGKTFLADLYADVTAGLETYRCRFISGTYRGNTRGYMVFVSIMVEVMPYGG